MMLYVKYEKKTTPASRRRLKMFTTDDRSKGVEGGGGWGNSNIFYILRLGFLGRNFQFQYFLCFFLNKNNYFFFFGGGGHFLILLFLWVIY